MASNGRLDRCLGNFPPSTLCPSLRDTSPLPPSSLPLPYYRFLLIPQLPSPSGPQLAQPPPGVLILRHIELNPGAAYCFQVCLQWRCATPHYPGGRTSPFRVHRGCGSHFFQGHQRFLGTLSLFFFFCSGMECLFVSLVGKVIGSE